MRSYEIWLVKDSGERFKAIKKNDAAKLNYKYLYKMIHT